MEVYWITVAEDVPLTAQILLSISSGPCMPNMLQVLGTRFDTTYAPIQVKAIAKRKHDGLQCRYSITDE